MASDWVLVPPLADLRTQLNAVAPNRDKRSDGTIGNQAHASGTSSHNPDKTGRPEHRDGDAANEVRAVDLDKDLNEPGLTMDMVVRHLVTGAKAGRFWWLRYIIWDRTIWSKSSGWAPRAYRGQNAHTEHAHINSDFTQAADTVRGVNYRLEDIPVALTAADKNWLVQQIDARADQIESNLIKALSASTDLVTITQNTAAEIGKKPGDRVPLGTLVQLAVIYAARADDKAALAVTQTKPAPEVTQ
jgi:galactitol-specific phosphotransferase system IIB component